MSVQTNSFGSIFRNIHEHRLKDIYQMHITITNQVGQSFLIEGKNMCYGKSVWTNAHKSITFAVSNKIHRLRDMPERCEWWRSEMVIFVEVNVWSELELKWNL